METGGALQCTQLLVLDMALLWHLGITSMTIKSPMSSLFIMHYTLPICFPWLLAFSSSQTFRFDFAESNYPYFTRFKVAWYRVKGEINHQE